MPTLTRVVAKAILFDEKDQVLLIRRSASDDRRPLQWDTPGGAVDEGEDYVNGAVREIDEESGIKISPENLHIAYSTSDMTEKGNVVWIYFVGRVKNTEPTLSNEHDQSQWVSLEEAFKNLNYERQITAFKYIEQHSLFPPEL